MISLKNVLAQINLAGPQRRARRACARSTRTQPRSAINEDTNCFPVLIFVGHRDGATEQPPHLIAELGVYVAAAAAVDPEGPHELGKRVA